MLKSNNGSRCWASFYVLVESVRVTFHTEGLYYRLQIRPFSKPAWLVQSHMHNTMQAPSNPPLASAVMMVVALVRGEVSQLGHHSPGGKWHFRQGANKAGRIEEMWHRLTHCSASLLKEKFTQKLSSHTLSSKTTDFSLAAVSSQISLWSWSFLRLGLRRMSCAFSLLRELFL